MEDEKYKRHIEHQFDAYSIRVIKNISIDLARRNRKRVNNECFMEDLKPVDKERILKSDEDNQKVLYRIKNKHYSKEMIMRAINNLSKESSNVINLYYYEELNDAQIGKVLNISRRLTTYKRNKALEKMKRYLEEENEKKESNK